MNAALIACINMIHQQQRRNQQAAYERRRREDERRRREASKAKDAHTDLTQTSKNALTEKMYMDALNAMRPYKDNLYVEAQGSYDKMKKETEL